MGGDTLMHIHDIVVCVSNNAMATITSSHVLIVNCCYRTEPNSHSCDTVEICFICTQLCGVVSMAQC